MISGYQLILLCLKTKKQFRPFFRKNSDIYRYVNCDIPIYLGQGFILVNYKYLGRTLKNDDSYRIYHMTSANHFEQVPFPELKQSNSPIQVYKKLSLLFYKKSCLYCSSLRTKKTRVIDLNFKEYKSDLAT